MSDSGGRNHLVHEAQQRHWRQSTEDSGELHSGNTTRPQESTHGVEQSFRPVIPQHTGVQQLQSLFHQDDAPEGVKMYEQSMCTRCLSSEMMGQPWRVMPPVDFCQGGMKWRKNAGRLEVILTLRMIA